MLRPELVPDGTGPSSVLGLALGSVWSRLEGVAGGRGGQRPTRRRRDAAEVRLFLGE